MIWINFKRILKAGWKNFWRNGVVSLSAVLIMSITLIIIASVIFTGALLENTLNGLREKVDVNISARPEVLEAEVLQLQKNLESLPEIETVEYINREVVLENYRARHRDDQKIIAALDELSDNPFGHALNIKAEDPQYYESIQNFLTQNYPQDRPDSIIENVNYAQKAEAIANLSAIITAGETFGAILTFLFILLSILITLNTIRLAMFTSKDEIKVMNLVGAESTYIRGPFIVAGAIYGVVSSIFVIILLYPATYWIGPYTADLSLGLNVFDYYISNFGRMFTILLFSGIVIGAISSFLAVNRYLKK
jgi:cell division transport system permease protein